MSEVSGVVGSLSWEHGASKCTWQCRPTPSGVPSNKPPGFTRPFLGARFKPWD